MCVRFREGDAEAALASGTVLGEMTKGKSDYSGQNLVWRVWCFRLRVL